MWRVIIVDDEQPAIKSIRKLFIKADIPFEIVGEAENGEVGIQLIRTLKPDVVVSDINMPIMDGVKMLQAVREEGYDCRFIMLTAISEFEYARQALRYGASDYVLKLSLDHQSLKQTMEKVRLELERMEKMKKADRWIPDSPQTGPTDHAEMNKIIAYIHEHYAENLSLKFMSEMIRMDASYVSDLFKKKTGQTLTSYIQYRRILAAQMLLVETKLTISEIGQRVGFENDNYFNKIFKKWAGVTPNEFRKEPKNVL